MKSSAKTIEVRLERLIPAETGRVFDAWLDPKVPGTTWNAAEKLILDPKENGLFYWLLKGTAHYGRFTEVQRPRRIRHTWMSPNTLGVETNVTVEFKRQGAETLMTIVHTGLPDTEEARGHEWGWTYFTGLFREQFGDGSRKKFSWKDASRGKK